MLIAKHIEDAAELAVREAEYATVKEEREQIRKITTSRREAKERT